ncbi:FAD-dependent oxidoreductase [Lacibacter sediminis]|uniref:FAD-dependent oxidoreductase n=1 Tax=Lacibacter sediminis TaxID=2760713 RepID=UPI001C7288DF|nr:FAD-dependent oxidoreductase [Lacibacter sediminis]
MKFSYIYHCFLFVVLFISSCTSDVQKTYSTDVLVVGGGTAGTAAGIQSARLGVQTIIAEETNWLGGMISSAGVSAFDGNHNMPSGIWAEFREKIYQVYGGPKAVETGWVSNTLFEPHVADSIFKQMTAAEKELTVMHQLRFVKALTNGTTITGAEFINTKTEESITIHAKQIIDATELGDVMASANVPFDMGMEADSTTGENIGVPATNDIIQDITYTALLKDYGVGADCTLVKPANYNPMEFDGCCNEFCSDSTKLASNVTAAQLLDYGKLPNGKYMINWPGKGNDIYLNLIPLTYEQRQQEIKKAKEKTIRFVYFLQTQFGFKHLDFAANEFPTADQLPLIPYHREGRRLQGVVRFKVQHIAEPFKQSQALYRTGISVGDYPIDHHHRENTNAPQHLNFYPVPSYNIPLGALIPKQHNGLIVAEKGISVSNIVNGTTRLQPVVLLTGQAAGALAAVSVQQNKQPREISVRTVQEVLLKANAYIMPYFDVRSDHKHFDAVQRIGATGILKGKGEPYKWANRTWFYPDSIIASATFTNDYKEFVGMNLTSSTVTIADAVTTLTETAKQYPVLQKNNKWNFLNRSELQRQISDEWANWGFANFDPQRSITRLELAVLLDTVINPFQLKEVDHEGHYK